MEVLELDNDTRGWIMCLVSGVACVIGSSIICVDVFVRLLPGKKNFRIQDSNTFLACSLSLSFGVMLFMSLYSMLPEAKGYLQKGGFSDQNAGFIMMGSFVGGFVGIQILSRLFHQFIPSHVVDCDHSHDDHPLDIHHHSNGFPRRLSSHARSIRHHSLHSHSHGPKPHTSENGHASETTPLLPTSPSHETHRIRPLRRAETESLPGTAPPASLRGARSRAATSDRRPSMLQKRVLSFVKDTKPNCDEAGPCYGYSDPCGQECFKHLSNRSGLLSRAPTSLIRNATTGLGETYIETVDENDDHDDDHSTAVSPTCRMSRVHSHDTHHEHEDDCHSENSEDPEAQHHHHVAENAFLSIGLQTSVAIALHKFPEGFITYATNHANPSLGFNVFLALFVHNISEGFALALPLYMALNSRPRAMLWSSMLGGLSQPFGASIAVLWFKLASHTNITPDAVAYGCLFAITAGIMASVALQLFVESLSLNHNQNLSILFAFLGMTLLGVSNAFTSHAH
ncbi:ZIP zinc transporter-domain-containing protein [Hypoxylon trugodes]|uniref:ZIP zinc transporter-domain-containing protein n=1 Tax=Hypoxylon trugodes TaxID=326681 RepID=UPI00219B8DCD|nr:ZIP zinc transporter-domain-containing protein [Hypoxylon trugodes]KAI1393672.1 ZIP zinc transporter-domain-containing protein [Hypoxylon trugodes]